MPESAAVLEAADHPRLQHHFHSLQQQKEASTLGMWAFLVTEIMFFGGLFLVYTVYRILYAGAFRHASQELDERRMLRIQAEIAIGQISVASGKMRALVKGQRLLPHAETSHDQKQQGEDETRNDLPHFESSAWRWSAARRGFAALRTDCLGRSLGTRFGGRRVNRG